MQRIKNQMEADNKGDGNKDFSPGFYWVGDLCYVIEDEDKWRKITSDIENNAYQKVDGLRLAIMPTMGDGVFEDKQGP